MADCVTEEVAISKLPEHVSNKIQVRTHGFIEKGGCIQNLSNLLMPSTATLKPAFKPKMIPSAGKVKTDKGLQEKVMVQTMDAEKGRHGVNA